MRKKFLLGFLACARVLLPPALADGAESVSRNVILATTSSTQDSGLLDVLVPLFENSPAIE
jgi:tungstate transport system substrate-binding protein